MSRTLMRLHSVGVVWLDTISPQILPVSTLISCSLLFSHSRLVLKGMAGAVPFTCIAVYAGMIISSVDDIDSLFTYTTTGWYCVYAALAVACVVSFVAIVRYTSAEMKAAVRSAPRQGDNGGDVNGGVDGINLEDDFGELPPDSTTFGTFTSRGGDGGGEGSGADNDEVVIAREPLLGGNRQKNGPVGARPVPVANGRSNARVEV